MRGLILVLIMSSGCASLTGNTKLTAVPENNLIFLYENLEVEFAFCVFGDVKNDEVRIERVELPFIFSATTESVWYKECSGPRYLGMGHSHPSWAVCEFSDMDVTSFLRSKSKYAFLLCDGGKLKTYSKRFPVKEPP